MNQGFLAREARQSSKKNKRLFTVMLVAYVVLLSVVIFAVKDSVDLSDATTQKVVAGLGAFSVLMLVSVLSGLVMACRKAADCSKTLILPFEDRSKEDAAKLINQEIEDGSIQADEYINEFEIGKQPHGERVMLIPSYLLLFNGMGMITAIPREKIYWLCAQAGRKNRDPFAVRLLIFTELKTFYLTGIEVKHCQKIADKLYRYIPNVFSGRDPFALSYELEHLFEKDRKEFLRFYEEEKKKRS